MPSAYQMTCRNQICANQAFSISNGLTVVALATNAAPSSIKPASAMIFTRSSLLYFSLSVSEVICVKWKTSNIQHPTSNTQSMRQGASLGARRHRIIQKGRARSDALYHRMLGVEC